MTKYTDKGLSYQEAAEEIVAELYANPDPDSQAYVHAESYLKCSQRAGWESAARGHLHKLLKEADAPMDNSESLEALADNIPYVSADELQSVQEDIQKGRIEF